MDLTEYDIILINTSAGKDSQTMMRKVVHMATEQGVLDRVTAVHADLGRVEWKGTPELAAQHAAHYGLRFEIVERKQNDLLDHVLALYHQRAANGDYRVPWPGMGNTRWCTSDHKRGPVGHVMTKLVRELHSLPDWPTDPPRTPKGKRPKRPAKLLNCMGLRAQESPDRAKKPVLEYNKKASGEGWVKQVWNWLPIHDWTEEQVWEDIHASGVPHHFAYDLGMPRLSCCFCIYSGRDALVLAAQHNPELALQYAAVEAETGKTMKEGLPFTEIVEAAKTETIVSVRNWAA